MFHGKGVDTYADGSQYKGAFKKGLFHGKGVLNSDGQIYIGEFKEGEHFGKGTITYYDKSQEIGEWKNGEFVVTQRIKAPMKKKAKAKGEEDEPFGDDEEVSLEGDFVEEDLFANNDIDDESDQEDIFAQDDIAEEPEQEEVFGQDDVAIEPEEDIFAQDEAADEAEEENIFEQDDIEEEPELEESDTQ